MTDRNDISDTAAVDEAPIVSVVLPTYNRADLVTRAAESVLGQTLPGIELIVVVDGSTDDTLQRLAPYGGRIRVISQANAGLGAARNKGIAAARGRYIAFIDDDDLWHPDKIRLQVEFFRAHPECSMVCAATAPMSAPTLPMDEILAVRNTNGIIERPLISKVAGRLLIVPSSVMYDPTMAPTAAFYAVRGCMEDVAFIVGVLGAGKLGVAGDSPLVLYNEATPRSLGSDANFWILGAQHMRRELSAGRLGSPIGAFASDTRELVAFIARSAAVRCLTARRFADGIRIYCREFPHQAALHRWRFLFGFPLLFAAALYPPGRR